MTSSAVSSEQTATGPSALAADVRPATRAWTAHLAGWRERHWSMLAAAVALAVTMAAFQPLPVGVWVDDGHYVVLARALATGRGYRYLNLPGAPFATHFPPGYPALLALLTRLVPAFPTNVRVFVFANALLTAAAAAGIVVLAYRRLSLPLPIAALTGVIWAVAVPTLMLSTAVMSEPLFLAMLLPTLLLAERVTRDGGARASAAAGVMLAACILVRSIGIAGFGAFALVLAMRRRWRELGIAVLTTAAGVAPWLVWKRLHQTPLPLAWAGMYGDYGAWLSDGLSSHGVTLVLRVALQNVRDVVEALAVYWSAGPDGVFRMVLAVALLLVTGVGLAIYWRRAPVVAWTLVGYMAIVLVWPFHPQRFVWGIGAIWIPFCCAGAWFVWEIISARVASTWVRATGAAVLVALALCIPAATILAARTRAWNRVPRSGAETLVPLLQWIVRNTPPGEIIAADAETVIYLYTGRRAVPYVPFKATDRVGLMTADEAYAGLAEMLRLYHPRWVLALGVPTLRVALHFTAHEGSPLRMTVVPKFGAVFEAHDVAGASPKLAPGIPAAR
jgi:hypothetical protein